MIQFILRLLEHTDGKSSVYVGSVWVASNTAAGKDASIVDGTNLRAPGVSWDNAGKQKGARVITVCYYGACKLQTMIPTAKDSVLGPVFSDKAIFTLSERACSEGKAHRFALTTIPI